MQFKDKITLAFSGASGAPYGLRLLEVLLEQQFQVYVLISSLKCKIYPFSIQKFDIFIISGIQRGAYD